MHMSIASLAYEDVNCRAGMSNYMYINIGHPCSILYIFISQYTVYCFLYCMFSTVLFYLKY